VFIIGARIHQWWKVQRWLPAVLAMPRMIRELRSRPDSGLLAISSGGGAMIQYWRSEEALMAYARDKTGQHFPAWAHFNRVVRASGAVGVWHEMYSVEPHQWHSTYVNMPAVGLGLVQGLSPAPSHGNRQLPAHAGAPDQAAAV
jgi:hypothetical protein